MNIQLRNGALRGTVDTHGGELVSLRGETEYIWGGDPAYWSGRNPVLFPIVGSLLDGTTYFQGRPFRMGRHGFARQKEFTVTEQGEDFAVLSFREDADTLARYPYPFLLRVTHRLLPDGFSTQFQVTNPGDEPLPFCIGAHTAFRCPLAEGETFSEYELIFDEPETADSLLLTDGGNLRPDQTRRFLDHAQTLPLDYAVFRELDTLIFEGLRSTGVALRNRRTGRGLRMEFEGFPMIAFWTRGDLRAPFVCLEPWHGCAAFTDEAAEFAQKPHCIVLEPGAHKTLTYRVKLGE